MATIRRRLGVLAILTITALGLCGSAAAETAVGQEGACLVYLARPDLRVCFAFPYCGGHFMYQYNQPVEDLCTADLPFEGYVSRLVYVDDNGTITPFDAPCDQPLTGSIEPDPDYPGFNVFVALACVR